MKSLHTERLVLRGLTLEDAARVEELAGDYQVARTTLTIPHPYPEGSAKDFITSITAAAEQGKLVIYAITEKETENLIGIINISLNEPNQRGELAYWIGKPYWGKGYGTEAAERLIQLGFENLNLNKIFAASFTDNPGSWRIMEKVGMKHEGTLRQHVVKWGEPIDLSYYSILKEEYNA
ncbi:GNAT family N-acetyltransferase [Peribacillus sp. SCS-155]|uniref:GNAT family N-acetyltransferase n=1 Tax=Peribacillus sedimenti TaxID=3115297 RepID=UPI003906C82E